MSELHMCFEVVRDDGAYESRNERVVVLRPVGALGLGSDGTVLAYGYGDPGTFQPGDRFDLVRRPERKDGGTG